MNPITEKLQRSWQLFKRSVQVLRDHPKLLVFPILTGLFTMGMALFFLVPVALVVIVPHWIQGTWINAVANSIGSLHPRHGRGFDFQLHPAGAGILAGMYLLDMFLATMCSVAFNSEILEALSGRGVSIRHGLEVACRRWKVVLLWSLLAGIVGLVIRAIEDRLALVGRLVAGLIGLAWSVAATFAIPILVREPSISNPFDILSKSAATIKRTWGEMLAGYVGMKGSNLLFFYFSILFWLATGAAALVLSNGWIFLMAGVPWLLLLIAYSYLASLASRVYLCALYLYASDGVVPGYYDPSMMTMGWKLRKQVQVS